MAVMSTSAVTGRWTMLAVHRDDFDVSSDHNPSANRWIELREDGTFRSGSDPYGTNTDGPTLDPTSSELYADSDVDEEGDSSWIVQASDPGLQLGGDKSAFKRRFRLQCRRE